MSSSSFIDPSSLAMSSPSPSYATRSPTPNVHHDLPSTSSAPQSSRKRARTELTSEERKEARAHRNRIAAQNSRDRRKAQYGYLERRVQELEEENRRLRAGLPMPPPPPHQPMHIAPAPHLTSLPSLASLASVAASAAANMSLRTPEEEHRLRRDQERERENEELKERIKTLERGWDAVVKALAAQGLPTGIPSSTSNDSQSPPSNTSSNTASSSSSSSSKPNSASSSTGNTTQAATTPSPKSASHGHSLSMNGFTAFPSPAPSNSSLDPADLDIHVPTSTPFALQPSIHTQPLPTTTVPVVTSSSVMSMPVLPSIDKNSTRHLARVATIDPVNSHSPGTMSLQRSAKATVVGAGYLPSPSITDEDDFGSDEDGCIADAQMEDLFREIFVESAPAGSAEEEQGNCGGVSEAGRDDGKQVKIELPEGPVGMGLGLGMVAGSMGTGAELNGGEQQRGVVGEKRKREDEEVDAVRLDGSTSMSDEEMQKMLSDMEVSMMMGSFDPSLAVLPVSVNEGQFDMGDLLGFPNDGTSAFMDMTTGTDFGNMWSSTTAAVPGVF